MKERGLTFCQELVPKVLDGTKTVTRRLGGLKEINENPDMWLAPGDGPTAAGVWIFRDRECPGVAGIKCPQGVVGDRFYIRETFRTSAQRGEDFWRIKYKAGGSIVCGTQAYKIKTYYDIRWRSGRFQPKWACRPQRWELVSIRPERLQEITDADIRAEGCLTEGDWDDVRKRGYVGVCQERPAHFCNLWNNINAKRGYPYDLNPWVWRVEWNPKPVVG